jgi:2-polyprenyl-3-methyl-5-hydroxy-6-metoxy-1,4-benzoquinol methylase
MNQLITLDKCPVCGEGEFVDRYPFEYNDDHWKVKSQYVECRECGHGFINPQPSDDDYDREYLSGEYRNYYVGEQGEPRIDEWLSDHNRAMRACGVIDAGRSQSLLFTTRTLDFGGGLGILAYLIKINYKQHVSMVEPYEKWSRYAVPHVDEVVKSLDELKTKTFDLITVCHVLEHMTHPVQTLISLYPYLVTGGAMYIEVPAFSPSIYHPQVFTPESLQRAVEFSGYRLLANGLLTYPTEEQPDSHWVLISKALEE